MTGTMNHPYPPRSAGDFRETAFHPDKNLPGCMMPDGGECCAGHAAVCEDWHKQRRQLASARKALEEIAGLAITPSTAGSVAMAMRRSARAALTEDLGK